MERMKQFNSSIEIDSIYGYSAMQINGLYNDSFY